MTTTPPNFSLSGRSARATSGPSSRFSVCDFLPRLPHSRGLGPLHLPTYLPSLSGAGVWTGRPRWIGLRRRPRSPSPRPSPARSSRRLRRRRTPRRSTRRESCWPDGRGGSCACRGRVEAGHRADRLGVLRALPDWAAELIGGTVGGFGQALVGHPFDTLKWVGFIRGRRTGANTVSLGRGRSTG